MKYEKGQFVTVPNVKYLQGLTAVATATYLWICSFSDENGICYPKRKTLGSRMSVDEKTVDKGIKELCEKGLLKKTARKDGDIQLTNLYQIMIKDEDGIERGAGEIIPHPGEKNDPARGKKRHTELNPINQTQLTKQRFMEWWGSYPRRRVDKDKCEKKFEKFSEEIQLQIIADTKKRVLEDEKWKKGFVPMTSTYLNNKKWEDDYEKVEVPASTGVKVYE